MPSNQFSVRASVPLLESLKDMPPMVSEVLKEGFESIAKVSATDRSKLVKLSIDTLQSRFSIGPNQLAHEFGVPPEKAQAFMLALSFLGALSVRDESAEELINVLTTKGLINQGESPAILAHVKAIGTERPILKQQLEDASLANRVLPSLVAFDTTIDVRVSVEKGKLVRSVPTIVVHLDTDADHQEVWFQLQKQDAERIIQELNRCLDDMKVADDWAKRQG